MSKAIFLLGFDTVKTCALAMLLVEGMSGKHAMSVRHELNHAVCASIVGREMARRSHYKDAEEAAIAALFKNIGRILVAAHEHDLYKEIIRLIEQEKRTPQQASLLVLGCSFELLAEAVLREWNMPETIIQALSPLPGGALKPARSRQEWIQQVAAFSSAAARLIPGPAGGEKDNGSAALLNRFGMALGIDHGRLVHLFSSVARETQVLASTASLGTISGEYEPETESMSEVQDELPESPEDSSDEEDLPRELLLDVLEDTQLLEVAERHASGKPMNARDLLLAGVQDVTLMMSSGRCKVNDLVLLVLETLYNSMGFRFATLCLKDPQTHQFKARISVGERDDERQEGFVFPVAPARDLFHLALGNEADLMISDAHVSKIRSLIPAWHRTLLPDARSFIILPLVIQQKQLGLFYADRCRPAPEGVPPDETALIKTLKGQVLAALNSR